MNKYFLLMIFAFSHLCLGEETGVPSRNSDLVDLILKIGPIYRKSTALLDRDLEFLDLINADIQKSHDENGEAGYFFGKNKFGYFLKPHGFEKPLAPYIKSLIWRKPGEVEIGIAYATHCTRKNYVLNKLKEAGVGINIDESGLSAADAQPPAIEGTWRYHVFIHARMGHAMVTLIPESKSEIRLYFTWSGESPECVWRIDVLNKKT